MLIEGEYVAWGWIEGETPTEGAKRPRIEGEARTVGEIRDWAGRGLGKGLGEPLRKFLKIHTWNCAIWCIVEAKIYLLLLLRSYLLLPVSAQFVPEQLSGPADPGNGTLYVKQRLLAIIRFFACNSFIACDSFFACNSFL